jgi:hypothetical protein
MLKLNLEIVASRRENIGKKSCLATNLLQSAMGKHCFITGYSAALMKRFHDHIFFNKNADKLMHKIALQTNVAHFCYFFQA